MVTHAPIATFHGRSGRLGPQASAALVDLLPRYGVEVHGPVLTAESLFGARLPLVVELGAGMGEATVALACSQPGTAVIAAEVHRPAVSALLRSIDREGLANLRVAHGDGTTLLTERIAPGSLAGIRAFFPDPWPKAKHHKRRLFRSDLVALMADRLAPGATLHAATDWADYAERMLEVLTAEPLLRNRHDGFAPRPLWRPVTGYERRGLAHGHVVRDLVFQRVAA